MYYNIFHHEPSDRDAENSILNNSLRTSANADIYDVQTISAP